MKEASNNSIKPKVWRKNLYSNFGYNDNYTDVTFLQNLRTNVNQRRVTFQEAVLYAGRVTEQLCFVFIFIVIYQLLMENVYQTVAIIVHASFITCSCYLYYLTKIPERSYEQIFMHIKTVVIFFIMGFILSPVLKTLTETISTDTINATTFVMMFIHLVFYDYSAKVAISSRALSLNAAIFGSLCLASRVPLNFHAFVLLTASAQCFVLYPPFAKAVRIQLTLPFLLSLIFVTGLLVGSVSSQMAVFFLFLVAFVNLFCPVLYVYLQKHKYNIYGPWDEAVITTKLNDL